MIFFMDRAFIFGRLRSTSMESSIKAAKSRAGWLFETGSTADSLKIIRGMEREQHIMTEKAIKGNGRKAKRMGKAYYGMGMQKYLRAAGSKGEGQDQEAYKLKVSQLSETGTTINSMGLQKYDIKMVIFTKGSTETAKKQVKDTICSPKGLDFKDISIMIRWQKG